MSDTEQPVEEIEIEDDPTEEIIDEPTETPQNETDSTLLRNELDELTAPRLRTIFKELNREKKMFLTSKGKPEGCSRMYKEELIEKIIKLQGGIREVEPVEPTDSQTPTSTTTPHRITPAIEVISKSLVSAQYAVVAVSAGAVNKIAEAKGSNIRVEPQKVYAENTDALLDATKVLVEEHFGPDQIGQISPMATLALIHFGLIAQSIENKPVVKKEELLNSSED